MNDRFSRPRRDKFLFLVDFRHGSRRAPVLLGLSAFAFALSAGLYQYHKLGLLGPPVDDTFIHLRFAWNLAHGEGFAFNPGEWLPGSTSPLWVLVLAPAAGLGKHLLVYASLFISALCFIFLGPLVWSLSGRAGLSPLFSLLAAGLTVLNGRLVWAGLSGMETCLFALLSLCGVILYLDDLKEGKMKTRTGLVFGFATLSRPEGYLLFAGALAHFMLFQVSQRANRARKRGWVSAFPWRPVLIYLVLVAPYIIFALVVTGSPFPTTYLAKRADLMAFRWKYLKFTVIYFWLDNPLAFILFLFSLALYAARSFRERISFLAGGPGLVGGWAIGYLVVSSIMTPMPFHFCRYQIPVLPFMFIMSAWAAQELFIRLFRGKAEIDRRRWLNPAAAALLGLALVIQLASAVRWPHVLYLCVKNIQEMHVRAGRWFNRATPESAVIATMDIGALGFYSDRKILDLQGLVTPEVIPIVEGMGVSKRRTRALLKFLSSTRPDYLAVFPEKYPDLLSNREVFVPLFEIRLLDNQIVASDWMVICKCLWDRYRPEAE